MKHCPVNVGLNFTGYLILPGSQVLPDIGRGYADQAQPYLRFRLASISDLYLNYLLKTRAVENRIRLRVSHPMLCAHYGFQVVGSQSPDRGY